MTMLRRPLPGRLPVSRAAVLGLGLFLVVPVVVSIAHAHERDPSVDEATRARTEINGTLERMASASQRVRDLLRVARKRGTKAQVACVDEALSRSDVARRAARMEGLEAIGAYARSELETARAARARVAELDAVQRIAERDGGKCFPPPVVPHIPPGTIVSVTVDKAIPDVRADAP
jgi:hypothetical protein